MKREPNWIELEHYLNHCISNQDIKGMAHILGTLDIMGYMNDFRESYLAMKRNELTPEELIKQMRKELQND